MSVLPLVQVGSTTAQAAIDGVGQFGGDIDTLGTRLGVAQLLRLQAEGVSAEPPEAPLLEAYRAWLDIAVRYYDAHGNATEREYARAAAILTAEIGLATRHQADLAAAVSQLPAPSVPLSN